MNLKGTTVEEDCHPSRVPTPRTLCWEEEKEVCSDVPELVKKDEHLNKCAVTLSEDECEKVRLTIPREICFHVQKYSPVYPEPPYHSS